jgi:hypothetical protein
MTLGVTAALAACAAIGWGIRSRHLRERQISNEAAVAERAGEWARERMRSRRGAHGSSERSGGVERARVLVVAAGAAREAIASRLASLDVDIALADSAWCAVAASRDAAEAGRPYNLVLLDEALAGAGDDGWADRLQADLACWGARVAVTRVPAAAGAGEEGARPHENPDRRGRSGVAPAVAGDAAAVGLRGGGCR